ncbi:MAG: tail fiber domain-containing protein [bacterium]|nr:tail fiber domain-containing protein [bacterium]
MKKSNAFTLAETIMTLFIVGLVVTAAIPMFTTTKHENSDEITTPWDNCQIDEKTHVKNGLCGVKYPEREESGVGKVKDVADNSAVVIGNNGEDETYKNYDLSLYDVNANDNMFDLFQADNRRFKVGGYNFIEDRTNFYILNETRLDDGTVSGIPKGDSQKNAIIGRLIASPTSVKDNVAVGFDTNINDNVEHSVSVGNKLEAKANNSTLFGESLIARGGVLIGKNLTPPSASVQIGIGDATSKHLNRNVDFNINDMIYGNATDGLTFYTGVDLYGRLLLTGSASLGLISDERLKNIKGSYTKGLNEVLQVEPIVFKYKGQNSNNIGVVAQDIQKIFPEAVVTMPDGYLGVTTDPIFFAMLNAINEVNKTTDEEAQRQAKLQKELQDLKAEIETLSACKRDDFWSRVRCFFYDTKLFIKSIIAQCLKNDSEVNYEKV